MSGERCDHPKLVAEPLPSPLTKEDIQRVRYVLLVCPDCLRAMHVRRVDP